MSTGRLVFCKHGGVRREPYRINLPAHLDRTGILHSPGWIVWAPCQLGDHFLAPDPHDPERVIECTVSEMTPIYCWEHLSAAERALAAYMRQQDSTRSAGEE